MEIFQNDMLIPQACLGYEQFCGPFNCWFHLKKKKKDCLLWNIYFCFVKVFE